MAGARIEKVGSIFKRVDGLYKGKVLSKENLPLWFDIYKAFPPLLEPTNQRPVPEQQVKNILYTEDFIKGAFLKKYKNNGPPYDLLRGKKTSMTHMDRYVKYFIDISVKQKDLNATQIENKVQRALEADGITLEPASV